MRGVERSAARSIEGQLLSLTDSDPFSPSVHDKVVTWEEKGQKELGASAALEPPSGHRGKAIGCSQVALDAHESEVRQREPPGHRGAPALVAARSRIGNFMTDAIREMHHTDAAIVPGGSIRGDKVFPAGNLTKTLACGRVLGVMARGKT